MMESENVQPGELDPRLWGSLPGEVLEAVFARMPPDAICRLKVLSTTWKKAASTYSTFTRLCAELQSSLYALLWETLGKYYTEPMLVGFAGQFYDASACEWMHPFRFGDHICFSFEDEESFNTLGVVTASDGGLVCFVNFQPGEAVLVCNLLTGEWRKLPLHSKELKHVRGVEMRVDRRTSDYEIILLAYSGFGYEEPDELRVRYGEVYSSRTNEWSGLDLRTAQKFRQFDIRAVISEDLAQYWDYKAQWNNVYVVKESSSEFAKDWLRNGNGSLVKDNYPHEELLSLWTLSIYEFGDGGSDQGGSQAPVVYNLIGVEMDDGDTEGAWRWIVSRSFLMIFCFFSEDHPTLIMLYDMEKGKWHECGRIPETTLSFHAGFQLACELRWDARP